MPTQKTRLELLERSYAACQQLDEEIAFLMQQLPPDMVECIIVEIEQARQYPVTVKNTE